MIAILIFIGIIIIALLLTIIYMMLSNNSKSKLDETILDSKINQSNYDLNNIVSPVANHLKELKEKVEKIEKERIASFSILTEGISSLQQETGKLKNETFNLSRALSKPDVRGKWGELQLKRVLTMAGMQEHIDFNLQAHFSLEEERIRPDAIVKLPDDKVIVIDSKTPLDGYLNALNDRQNQETHLHNHVEQVKMRIKELAKKNYWEKLSSIGISPDFAVLFLPAENLFASALDYDPTLIEFALENKVLIATPTTLISLLKSVSFGWKQKYLEEDSKKIVDMAKELYERLATMTNHFDSLGKSLNSSIDNYNKTISSLETRVLPSVKKLQSYSIKDSTMRNLNTIEKNIKTIKHK